MILNTTFQIENVKDPARVQNEYVKLISKQSSVKSKIYFLGSALNVPAALGMDIITNGRDLNKRDLDAKILIRFWLIDIKSGEVLLSAIYSSKNEALSNNLLRAREKFDSNLGVKSRL
jgi:hypothetical protein